jgi:hypothetical protein
MDDTTPDTATLRKTAGRGQIDGAALAIHRYRVGPP